MLILDEPVANLDPMAREAVWALLADWRKGEGGTAIVCSHILAEMEEEASDFAIIDRGHVLKSGRVADIAETSNTFKVETASNVSIEQIKSVLAAAGIVVDVTRAQASLSKVYKETV